MSDHIIPFDQLFQKLCDETLMQMNLRLISRKVDFSRNESGVDHAIRKCEFLAFIEFINQRKLSYIKEPKKKKEKWSKLEIDNWTLRVSRSEIENACKCINASMTRAT